MTEHEADKLEARSEALGEEIEQVREDVEAQRRDESVPTAPAPESGLPPEANFTTSGDTPPQEGEEDQPETWSDEDRK
jgi:hypothetical protein